MSAYAEVFARHLIDSEEITNAIADLHESIAVNIAHMDDQPLLQDVTRHCIMRLLNTLGHEKVTALVSEAETSWRAGRIQDGWPDPKPAN
jgi:hypothetical protein